MNVQIRLFAQLRELMGSEILHEEFAAERVTVAELQRRLSTVGEAVLKNQPSVLKMYKLMKKVAARTEKG